MLEKARGKGIAQEARHLEKVKSLQPGLETVKIMKELLRKGNLGRGSQIFGAFGGETARDRAAYEQYGRSLIPLVAAGVPVKNQREFEEYKRGITDPSVTDAEMEGALDSLQDLFTRS